MPIEGVRANSSHLYSSEPDEATCAQDKHKPTSTSKVSSEPKASVLDAWDRMEASYTRGSDAVCGSNQEDASVPYTPGSDAVCGLPPKTSPETTGPVESKAENCECPEPAKPDPKMPPETYEQCVNRGAYEASVTGRWSLAAGGCATAGASVVPLGPVGMAAGCVGGAVGGYYSGGTAGASIGTTDAKVECDTPDRAGSPSAKALEQMNTSSFHAPIKG